jgi:hypothetical protein
MLSVYQKYSIGYKMFDNMIGLTGLFKETINEIIDIEKYDFIFYIRIDLFLKPHFFDVFNPTINTIQFPTICWFRDCRTCNDPRVNDMMLFIPKKYYYCIKTIDIRHETWHLLIKNNHLTYDDLDVMINTYHDSDSAKDFNPLYYIVNRRESTYHHSNGRIFNKYHFKISCIS